MNDVMKIISLPPTCQIAAHHTSARWVPCLVQTTSAPQSPVKRRGSARLHFPTDTCASQEGEQRNLTALFQRQTDGRAEHGELVPLHASSQSCLSAWEGPSRLPLSACN